MVRGILSDTAEIHPFRSLSNSIVVADKYQATVDDWELIGGPRNILSDTADTSFPVFRNMTLATLILEASFGILQAIQSDNVHTCALT